jgi:hypothetical protein
MKDIVIEEQTTVTRDQRKSSSASRDDAEILIRQRVTLESLTGEEKGDWLAALFEHSAPPSRLAGRVPVPFFRLQHECDLL